MAKLACRFRLNPHGLANTRSEATHERLANAHDEVKHLRQSQRSECWIFAFSEVTLAMQLDTCDKATLATELVDKA